MSDAPHDTPPPGWKFNNPNWPSGEGEYLVRDYDEPGSQDAEAQASRLLEILTDPEVEDAMTPEDRELTTMEEFTEGIERERALAWCADLLVENKRLRADLAEAVKAHELSQTQIADLAAWNERLREKVDSLSKRVLNSGPLAIERDLASGQRDALADALIRVLYDQLELWRQRAQLAESIGDRASDEDVLRWWVERQPWLSVPLSDAVAALRAAGRLPGGGGRA